MFSPDENGFLRLSRAYAAKHLPWFAPALYRCHIVFTEQVPVAAIDPHYNIYWNPGTVKLIRTSTHERERGLAELAFIWIHEISHNLREHYHRRQEFDAKTDRWNCCADLEINDVLWLGTRHPTLFPPILPANFQLPGGQLAEWYYRQEATKSQGMLLLDCGSGAHGKVRPWELQEKGQRLSDIQLQIIRRTVALEMSKQPLGAISGGWKMWITHTLHPKADWRKILKQRLATSIAVGSGSKIDYSFRRPSRKHAVYAPFILPVLVGSRHGQLAVVIDTSGSMTGQPLSQAVAELYGILRQAHQYVTLIPCDVIGYKPVILGSANDLRKILELPGGGGTNMVNGIMTASALKPQPDTILVLTDGQTPYPSEKIGIPLIFGIISPPGIAHISKPPCPPWGNDSVIEIEIG